MIYFSLWHAWHDSCRRLAQWLTRLSEIGRSLVRIPATGLFGTYRHSLESTCTGSIRKYYYCISSSTRSSFRNSRTSTVVLEFPGFVNVRGDDGLDGDGDEDSGHLVIVTLMVVVGVSCR